jgi:hypothetical protein
MIDLVQYEAVAQTHGNTLPLFTGEGAVYGHTGNRPSGFQPYDTFRCLHLPQRHHRRRPSGQRSDVIAAKNLFGDILSDEMAGLVGLGLAPGANIGANAAIGQRAIMIEVAQAFDRTPIARLDSDDAAALDRKIEAARRLFANRGTWLKSHQRIELLRKLARLMEGKREHLGHQIAREGGKPLTDALIETDRAIDGVRNAVDELRVRGGREIPMGLTSASIDRRAFTIVEPIGARHAALLHRFRRTAA